MMKVLFDDITKYVVEFDDDEIDSDVDIDYINRLTKQGVDFEVCDDNQIIIYR